MDGQQVTTSETVTHKETQALPDPGLRNNWWKSRMGMGAILGIIALVVVIILLAINWRSIRPIFGANNAGGGMAATATARPTSPPAVTPSPAMSVAPTMAATTHQVTAAQNADGVVVLTEEEVDYVPATSFQLKADTRYEIREQDGKLYIVDSGAHQLNQLKRYEGMDVAPTQAATTSTTMPTAKPSPTTAPVSSNPCVANFQNASWPSPFPIDIEGVTVMLPTLVASDTVNLTELEAGLQALKAGVPDQIKAVAAQIRYLDTIWGTYTPDNGKTSCVGADWAQANDSRKVIDPMGQTVYLWTDLLNPNVPANLVRYSTQGNWGVFTATMPVKMTQESTGGRWLRTALPNTANPNCANATWPERPMLTIEGVQVQVPELATANAVKIDQLEAGLQALKARGIKAQVDYLDQTWGFYSTDGGTTSCIGDAWGAADDLKKSLNPRGGTAYMWTDMLTANIPAGIQRYNTQGNWGVYIAQVPARIAIESNGGRWLLTQ